MILAALLAAILPAHLDAAAPFPRITSDAPMIEPIAPGVEYGEYDLLTSAGPIVVHAIAVAPHAANIALNSVLADDTLASGGETISSMAARTGAIAGINADYFDIGKTNRPTNIVVRDGELVRSPRKRYALIVPRSGPPQILETGFVGTVQLADHSVALDAVNANPGHGTTLLTPAFGAVAASNDTTLVALAPTTGTPPFATYRVISVADNTVAQPPGYYLEIGLDAYASAGVPNAGDTIAVSGDLSPLALTDVLAAVGGGPLILDNGTWTDDPDGPSGGEYAQRIPCSGAAIAADGTLYLLEVDGREPELSVGITRVEFSALMRAFGAVRGMAFDGGGSSELAVRAPGDRDATLADVPSDGHERKVADGIFVYDTAPVGPASQLVAQPLALRAMPNATIAVRFAATDVDDHLVQTGVPIGVRVEPATLGTYADGNFTALHAGDGELIARSGALTLRLPVHVYDDPARVVILPQDPSVVQGGRLNLQARAFDAQGYAIALPAQLPWRAQGGSIDATGTLAAGNADSLVSLLLGEHLANAHVTVGFHDVQLISKPGFMTVPRGGEGSAGETATCLGCMELNYALNDSERAAYLLTDVSLPARSVAVAFEVNDDGQGALLKLALRNAINEEVLLSVGPLDHAGWRSVVVHLPLGLAQPARLVGIYVIGANASVTLSGRILVKNLHAVVAGTHADQP
ncbi:MAG TPA: phosphodiester glycosidase family protein [Candidatus Acidoferrum sp.]|nr:phosphodiester glycosidase family protein [Candidatus Acidoferrum sp.]